MRDIKFGDKKYKDPLPGVRFVEGTLPGNTRLVVGVDPGVNFGITVAYLDDVRTYWGRLPKVNKEPGKYGLYAYDYIETLLVPYYKLAISMDRTCTAVVEGAAYRAGFGQVGLEEIRFGFYLSLYHMGFRVKILSPATIRKMAFGSGTQQAWEVWPTINHNGADSVGALLAAMDVE